MSKRAALLSAGVIAASVSVFMGSDGVRSAGAAVTYTLAGVIKSPDGHVICDVPASG